MRLACLDNVLQCVWLHNVLRCVSLQALRGMLLRHRVQAVAVGNGVGSVEAEAFVAGVVQEVNAIPGAGLQVGWAIVNEAGEDW